MNSTALPSISARIAWAAAWLTPRRIRAQGVVLAVCLWGVCAVDFATPGLFDRVGNVKFQDFLPLYVSGRLIAQGRANDLYNQQVIADEIKAIIHPAAHAAGGQLSSSLGPAAPASANLRLPNLYGPQVALLFAPFSRLSFPAAAWTWTTACLLVFFLSVYVVWRICPRLRSNTRQVAIAGLAFPPLFHFFVRGQLSVLVLICFTAAFLALRAGRGWLAGVALGLLVFKPPFLLAIPLVLLLAGAWKMLAGLSLSVAAQSILAWIYFGSAVMRAYLDTLWHLSRWLGTAEPGLAPIQMHSLRSFWALLIPWPDIALPLYVLSSIVIIATAAAVCKSASPLALRFAALTLAAVLANPHLFVYDLLVLAPALLLLVDWTLANPHHPSAPALQLLLYLAFVLPLLGPLSRWTHFQLSIPVFCALLWVLRRYSAEARQSPGQLASGQSRVV